MPRLLVSRNSECNCSHGLPGSEATHLPPGAPMANFGESYTY
jgi:hypothetical protein